MKIGGLLRFSMLDYPGRLSCVVFCQGCPLRCPYCHNPGFLQAQSDGAISFDELIAFLETRVGQLDAVVFSGGEPLLQTDLAEAMTTVKRLGFAIGIHTSGVLPQRFVAVLPLVCWVGFDIKTVFEKYQCITGLADSGRLALQSFERLIASGVDFEARTTLDSRHISDADCVEIAETLGGYGVKKWVIQECILRGEPGNPRLSLPSQATLELIKQHVQIEIRNG